MMKATEGSERLSDLSRVTELLQGVVSVNRDRLDLYHALKGWAKLRKEFGNEQGEEEGGSARQPCPDGRLSRYIAAFPGKCCALGCTLTSPFPRRSRPGSLVGIWICACCNSPPPLLSDLGEPQARSFQISPSEGTNPGFTEPALLP